MHCALPPKAPPVPAALVIRTTACGYVKVVPGGRVVRWHAPHWPGTARAGHGVWVRHTGGRLTLVRNGRVFWRSRVSRGSDAVVIHGRTIAYAAYPSRYEDSEEVWLARVGGSERRIARHEGPLGWTRAGLLLLQRGRDIDVRDSSGRHRAKLRFRQSLFQWNTSSLLALTYDGRLVRSDGRSSTTIAHVVDRRWTITDVLRGGLIVLTRTGALLVLDRDGHRYAFAAYSQHADVGGTITALPDGSIVFPLLRGGIDRVLLLQRGARKPVQLLARRLPPSCGHWTSLTYHRGRLLYASQGRIVVVDPLRKQRPIDLTRFVRSFAPRNDEAFADWAVNLG